MEKVQCRFCGKDVWKKPSHIKRYKHFFCDKKCQNEFHKSKRTEAKCDACGKVIYLNALARRNSKTGLHFCNNKCKNPYVARYRRWQGQPEKHRKRRPLILKKAKYTCQNCGYNEHKKMLDIHHINGDNKDNNWTNLTCLCVMCHIGYHRKVIELDLKPLFLDNNVYET